ncbi:GNAT family N-acetyltransferase [Pseudoalteromonas rubra]|uniref:Molybdopterin-guanine dinucleotide biosynthesis protein MobC n=1 Tax=Pseudoalteromonas rubra TaxID=43658 RepID=A0A0F4QSG4_9GAMM|nr:GNAT family N-acetyltransferase [Pseudoalteromonas rubra]KJZ10190.1 molybdopterin-guanine dinucleotide biosynthesis protein MobC [Pseudoalteromonas rubra]
MTVKFERGWDIKHAQSIAKLYDQAFGSKFSHAIPDKAKRVAVLQNCFIPRYSFVALHNDTPIGIAGFSDGYGALTGGLGIIGLIKHLGLPGGIRAGLLFSLYERQPDLNGLVMDGIAVQEAYRGQGIGAQLLDCIVTHAQRHKYSSVRLDVIDRNARARKLYEAKGFVAVKTEHFPYLNWLLGFSGSTTMQLNLSPG